MAGSTATVGNETEGSSDIENLEDSRRLVKELREKMRSQSQQLLAWRRAYKMQVMLYDEEIKMTLLFSYT